ncbi:alpha/beta hydrolase [Flexibacterium corallicola]|uniref:alpha/beta hydrolase n=1 Tax=Flexibacterium corallicola TaxID=3037259 RepID=UPI00286F5802|nr:alpha/beta hydrolase [Pseudovibrio sp. M1P-2-3]
MSNTKRSAARSLDRVLEAMPSWLLGLPRNRRGYHLSPLLNVVRKVQRGSQTTLMNSNNPKQLRKKIRDNLLPLQVSYEVQEVRNVQIDLSDRLLNARLYIPKGKGSLPALTVYFHGGGYIFGDLDTHDDLCRLLCRESGTQVLSVEYRLAPEHPFPAALQDAIEAFHWAQKNAKSFGVSPSAIALAGDSAGGNLATVAAQDPSQYGPPLAQLLVYPGTDGETVRPSHTQYGDAYFLDLEDRKAFQRYYLSGGLTGMHDPQVSPLLGDISPEFAPALIATAGFDILHDEGEAYATKLVRAGVQVDYLCFERLVHGFGNMVAVHRASEKALLEVARRWKRLCYSQLGASAQVAVKQNYSKATA